MRVIAVVCDALHFAYLGCYGNEWIGTPNLDRLAHEGFVFDHCYPDQPSDFAWLKTGMSGQCLVSPRVCAPLARLLSQQGVHTALFGDRIGLSSSIGQFEDFDTFVPIDMPTPPREDWSLDHLLTTASEWITKHNDEKFLLWLEIALQANPWLPPRDFQGSNSKQENGGIVRDPMPGLLGQVIAEENLPGVRAAFAERISYFDEQIGNFLEALRQRKILDDCLLIVTSNQGMPLGEHGLIGHARPWLYEERAHVPLLMCHPTGQRAARSLALVQSVDLFPTLCDYFGIDRPLGTFGQSLIPFLTGEATRQRDYACFHFEDFEYAIRTRHWKLLLPLQADHDEELQPRQLFAKPEDRWDTNDICEQHLQAADHLELQLRRYFDAHRRGTVHLLPPLREELLLSEQ